MRRLSRVAAVVALVIGTGCRSTAAPTDELALLLPDDAAGRAEIVAILNRALGTEQLRLSDSMFQESSILLIEPAARADAQRPDPVGRDFGRPERFTLVVSGDGCALIRQSTRERWALSEARCMRNLR